MKQRDSLVFEDGQIFLLVTCILCDSDKINEGGRQRTDRIR